MAAVEFQLDTRIRRCHIPLITQQHRLRHLRSMSARNVIVSDQDSNSGAGLYFSLHHNPDSPSIYTSEVLQETVNPSWKNFETCSFPPSVNVASPCVTVKVWNTASTNSQPLIEWVVFFSGLSYLGEQIPKEGKNFKPNTLIFGMHEGYYGSSNCQHVAPENTELFKDSITAECSSVRTSYTLSTLNRIKTIETAIKQTQAAVYRNRKNIETRLRGAEQLHRVYAERERLRIKIDMLRAELHKQRHHLHVLEEEASHQQEGIDNRRNELIKKCEELQKYKTKLTEMGKCYCEFRESFLKTEAQLSFRRKQLISELSFIYPITMFPDQKGFSIHHAHLPNSENFSGHDETMISVALGYVCHVVLMISLFLNVPLRYSVKFSGSRSTIIDHISVMIPDKVREFPLYTKGKDRKYFDYGVYLLNKNIAQLRIYCGLITKDLSATLPNLSSLIELRLSLNSDPYAAVRNTSNLPNQRQPTEPSKYALESNKSLPSIPVLQVSDVVNSETSQALLNTVCTSELEYLKKEMEEMMPSVTASKDDMITRNKLGDASTNLSCSLDKGLNDFKVFEKSFEGLESKHSVPPVKMVSRLKKLGQGVHHSSYPNLNSSLHTVEIDEKFHSSSENSHSSATPLKMWVAGSSQTNSDDEQFLEEPKQQLSAEIATDASIFYAQVTNSSAVEQENNIPLPEDLDFGNNFEKAKEAIIDDQDFNADLTLRTELLAKRSSSFQMQRINSSTLEQLDHL